VKHLSLILSEKCNLNCSYCYITDKQSSKKISFEAFEREFEKIYDANEDYILDIMGGEPLLQMDLVEKFIEYGNFRHFTVNIMTNGFMLTPKLVNYLNSKKVNVSVSYDGLWQSERGNTFPQSLIDTIKKIDSLKVHCMWNGEYFGLTDNQKHLENLFGVDPNITLVRDIGTWHEGNIQQTKQDIKELMNYSLETNTIPGFFAHFLAHILRYHKKGYTPKDCGAGDTVLAFHDDNFYSCYRYFDKEDIFSTKVNSEQIQDFCKTCEVNQYCEKGCLIQQLENQKPIEYLCEIYKYIYSLLISNINTLNSDIIAEKINYV
jgi:uncharacterized protein